MKRSRIPIPKPRSNFLLIQCTSCGNEQTIFSNSTMDVKCRVCGAVLLERSGGKAIPRQSVLLRRLD